MASSYSSDLTLEIITTGEKAGLWGTITNTNLEILQQASSGYVAVPMTSGTDVTLSLADGSSSANGKNIYLKLTGTMTASINLIIPATSTGGTVNRVYIIEDATDRTTANNYTLNIKTTGSSNPVPVPEGANLIVRSDGTDTALALIQKGMKTITSSSITSYTAVNNDQVIVDTQANGVTITLPISPVAGNEVTIMDGSAAGGFATNAVTVARNGSNINGAASDYSLPIIRFIHTKTATFRRLASSHYLSASSPLAVSHRARRVRGAFQPSPMTFHPSPSAPKSPPRRPGSSHPLRLCFPAQCTLIPPPLSSLHTATRGSDPSLFESQARTPPGTAPRTQTPPGRRRIYKYFLHRLLC